ncbi:MAG: NusG domain II-containing protein [Lawsonibacter sp.]|jgi:hypothetical protein
MSRGTKLTLGLLLAAALAATVAVLVPAKKFVHPVAKITLDGALIQEIDLEKVGASYSFTVEGATGLTNTILVESGRIRVLEATCPDQVCVEQGFISDGTVPIVCLPNKLIIEIVGGGETFDAATG